MQDKNLNFSTNTASVETNLTVKEAIMLIRDYERNVAITLVEQKRGIISAIDATNDINMYKKKEMKIKEELVRSLHKNNDGTPRKIQAPTEKCDMWYTKLPGRSNRTYAKTREALVEKIYDFYCGTKDLSFKNIFQEALVEKEHTENVTSRTIERIQQDYNYFVSEDFGKLKISDITAPMLREYVQQRTKELNPSEKRLKAFKGLLNMTFKYALYYDLTNNNPVNALELRRYYPDCKRIDHSPEANIFSPEEIETIKKEVRRRIESGKCNGYYINGYITFFAIETGMRVAELCALKWADISEDTINIHAQQSWEKVNGTKVPYYEDSTKEEKRVSRGGRMFPIMGEMKAILDELKALQAELGIESEFVFCNLDGSWVKTSKYTPYLQRLLRSLKLKCPVTKNHGFRKTLNSNVLVPAGMTAPDRAAILGHTPETNERHYTFPSRDYLDSARKKVNAFLNEQNSIDTCNTTKIKEVNPELTQNIVPFEQTKKPESLIK